MEQRIQKKDIRVYRYGLAKRLEIIAGDLKYADDLAIEDFEQMEDELNDIRASLYDWIERQDPKEKRFNS